MVHKKVLGAELSSKVERLSLSQLRVLLVLILSLLSEKGRLSKKQRKSLAITESQLGIRKAVKMEKGELEGKGKKRKYRMTPARKRALRKAIHANPRMSAAAKRKALAKLK